MKFILEIELGNDAMRTGRHVADAMVDVAKKVRTLGVIAENYRDGARIRDVNGNTVGKWEVQP